MGELRRLRSVLERIEEKMPERERHEHYRNPHDRDSEFDVTHGKVPKKIDIGLAVRAIPGLAGRLREVPARAIAEEGEDEHGRFALMTCACGQNPIVRSELTKCDGCERWYLLITGPWVLYGDMDVPDGKPGALAVD